MTTVNQAINQGRSDCRVSSVIGLFSPELQQWWNLQVDRDSCICAQSRSDYTAASWLCSSAATVYLGSRKSGQQPRTIEDEAASAYTDA